ncbi:MAG: bifunctional phosphoribosylaminoimidazolecarboxamide formyltransferase/IMP cyclohydrolase [Candidatus Dormibacteria bacterium]
MKAILSVYDKTGLAPFARGLRELGFELYSTGGTRRALEGAGLAVAGISELTDFPEIMDGRVKTLHPGVHAGILANRAVPEHMEQLRQQGLEQVDLVCVNLYPFEETVARPGVSFAEAIENIDIGGPTMIRAAAKNHASVVVVVSPADYDSVLAGLGQGALSVATRLQLALTAYSHTASYDAAISRWLRGQVVAGGEARDTWPVELSLGGRKVLDLRYGENPHQSAALYRSGLHATGVAAATKLQGIELSFNNIVDIDAAWSLAQDLPVPSAAIIKHTNPCGVAHSADLADAYQRAFECDRVSAFGGIVALNAECDEETAQRVCSIMVEAVAAPAYTEAALQVFATKPRVRVLRVVPGPPEPVVKAVSGGFLVQGPDQQLAGRESMRSVGHREPTEEEWRQLAFAWVVAKHVKSNAIVLARDNAAVGVGAGQMSRVESVQIAVRRAGTLAAGTVLASDAFFPFPDGVEAAVAAGITAVVQPGGSVKDAEVLAVADAAGVAMVYTGERHFRH